MRVLQGLMMGGLLSSAGLVGCTSSHGEGVKSDYRTQWTTVNADTKTTADAAAAVLQADDLKDVKESSTNVDGTVSGKKSDGKLVKVDIQKKDAASQVSVTVGTLGDPDLGASYAQKIKTKAEAK